VGAACPDLDLNDYVCVGAPGATQTTTTTTTATSTTGTPAPSPIESGTISTCKTYHLVVQGDYCALPEENYGITATQFNAWNPDVGTSCADLDLGEYVCVGA
jgi:LysM repeat protein